MWLVNAACDRIEFVYFQRRKGAAGTMRVFAARLSSIFSLNISG